MTYGDVVLQFLYQEFPTQPVPPDVRFEAISGAVIGSKQRRYGPVPKPEVQVAVRDVIRADHTVRFLLPWGCRKQTDGAGLDVLEFMALKQLVCLRDELRRYGRDAHFTFRLDDLTDLNLFGDESAAQVREYGAAMVKLIQAMLPESDVQRESHYADIGEFRELAAKLAPVFYKYLNGDAGPESLAAIGWSGLIPEEQRDYYRDAYRVFYPGQDANWKMAQYFANTLTRVRSGAGGRLGGSHAGKPFIFVSYTRPVPGNPMHPNRLYYRTLPERFTHKHVAPWIGTGYVEIDEGNTCTPKIAGYGERVDLTPQTIDWNGVRISAPYVLK